MSAFKITGFLEFGRFPNNHNFNLLDGLWRVKMINISPNGHVFYMAYKYFKVSRMCDSIDLTYDNIYEDQFLNLKKLYDTSIQGYDVQSNLNLQSFVQLTN